VHRALVQSKDLIGTHRTGREELHRAHLIEEIQDPPHGIISKRLCWEDLSQEECCVLLGKERFEAIQGAAPT